MKDRQTEMRSLDRLNESSSELHYPYGHHTAFFQTMQGSMSLRGGTSLNRQDTLAGISLKCEDSSPTTIPDPLGNAC